MIPGAAPLAHRISGDGPPVVLLNGGMMTFASWEPVAARLRDRYRLLGFDFRGQLLSPGAAPASLRAHAADVEALLDHLGWSSAHLVGTSFGAEVALELASAAPARVRSLIVATAMDRETPELRRQTAEMRAILDGIRAGGERERFHDVLAAGVYSAGYLEREAATLAARRAQIGQLPAAWFDGVDALLAAIEGFDLTARLAAIRCPALVIAAAGDEVMSVERSRALAAALGAEITVHPTSGHALVAEDPDWFATVCERFLAVHAGAST